MTYKFHYRRRLQLLFRTFTVVGHSYNKDMDRMMLYLPDGGVHEICQWSWCDARLGQDWVLAMKKDMEKKAGQSIPVAGT